MCALFGGMEENVEVDSRLVCDGYFGTVRYVGEVPPTKGQWLGVEWDDASRGKHDGIYEGTRYFTCNIKDSGSFLRPRKANFGTTFLQTVKERYGEGKAEVVELYVDVKSVEMVGWDKLAQLQSHYDRLDELSLRGMLVSSPGPPGEIEKATPNVTKLDLSCNQLLSNMEPICAIASQLKQLKTLQLSENRRLCIPSHPPALKNFISSPFAALGSLFVNKMGLTWSKVSVLLQMTPTLEELHACENKIDSISDYDCFPKSLALLNLEENELSDWNYILRLNSLPKLRILILNDNKFTSLSSSAPAKEPGASLGGGSYFSALESLSLKRNLISHWDSINGLAVFPSITDMKFQGNPLVKDQPVFVARQLLISRMGNINSLNNSLVTKRERWLAEQYYLKHYADEFRRSETSGNLHSQFLELHPRFLHLISVHGLPDVNESKSPVVSTLKEGLVSVTISHPSDPTHKDLTKKLPLTMTVQKLKGLIQRLYRVDTSSQQLSCWDREGRTEVNLSDNLKQLGFYSLQEGDTILLK